MITLVKQESYKLMKKRSTLLSSGFLVLFQIVIAAISLKYPRYFPAAAGFSRDYYALALVVFFLIAASSSIIAMESQYGTLRALLYRRYTDWQVLVSKWLTILGYSIYLYGLNMLVSLAIKFTLFNQKFSLSDSMGAHRLIWQDWLLHNLSDFMTVWFLLSLVMLLATMLNSTSPAIITGIVGYFVLAFANGMLFLAIQQIHWLKWNPINMMNAGGQLQDSTLSQVTLLNTPEILSGYAVYIVIFLALGLVSFRRRAK